MLDLTRTVRFSLNGPSAATPGVKHNGFSGWPAMRGLGRFYQLHVRCRGRADAVTGYFINITDIDKAVRTAALPCLRALVADERTAADAPLGDVLRRCVAALQPELGGSVAELTLELTPYYRLSIRSSAMDHVVMRQQYEFSAAHRLHVASLSDEENRRIFGKCNNPSGHGHNYRVEVAVRAPIDPAGRTLDVDRLDAVVDAAAIQKLDHKHLNVDVPAFASLNPSVENIAKVIHAMLAGPVTDLGVALEEISVWETSKTVCTYRGE